MQSTGPTSPPGLRKYVTAKDLSSLPPWIISSVPAESVNRDSSFHSAASDSHSEGGSPSRKLGPVEQVLDFDTTLLAELGVVEKSEAEELHELIEQHNSGDLFATNERLLPGDQTHRLGSRRGKRKWTLKAAQIRLHQLQAFAPAASSTRADELDGMEHAEVNVAVDQPKPPPPIELTTSKRLRRKLRNSIQVARTAAQTTVVNVATKTSSYAQLLTRTTKELSWYWYRFLKSHPIFYLLLLTMYIMKAYPFVTDAYEPRGTIRQASDTTTVISEMGIFFPDVPGGAPAPMTFDGTSCLPLPNYYAQLNSSGVLTDPEQRVGIPWVYAFMHCAVLSLALMPLPQAHATWTVLVQRAPWLRSWWALPVDDFERLHKLLGSLCILFIIAGMIIWLAVMVPDCIDELAGNVDVEAGVSGSACDAFQLTIPDPATGIGTRSDPIHNVVILRLIVGPTWFFILPLMFFVKYDWSKLLGPRENEKWYTIVLDHFRHPPVYWLFAIGLASGSAFGLWAGGTSFGQSDNDEEETGRVVGSFTGLGIGGILGLVMAFDPGIKRNWFEVCYWSHCIVAYSTVIVACVSRFDVFWPGAITWAILVLDKVAQSMMVQTAYIDLLRSRCFTHKDGKPSVVRLVLNPQRMGTQAATSAAQWVYLKVPDLHRSLQFGHLQRGGFTARAACGQSVARTWHPFSLAGADDSYFELLIGVHDKVNGVESWTEMLFHHLSYHQKLLRGEITPEDASIHLHPGAAPEAMTDKEFDKEPAKEIACFAPQIHVQLKGPFGSAFSRCFDDVPRRNQIHAPKYHAVILIGSGIGLPSALSALREFFRRRAAGVLVPPFVYFVWQCRNTEELAMCWESIHRIVFSNNGMTTKYAARAAESGLTLGRDLGLSHARHVDRFGEEWHEASLMLDWLGVQLNVSRWKEQDPALGRRRSHIAAQAMEGSCKAAAPSTSAAHAESAPSKLLAIEDSARSAEEANLLRAERIHSWLKHPHRLKPGYMDLSEILVQLEQMSMVAKDKYTNDMTSGHRGRSVCISLCGSPASMDRVKEHVYQARDKLQGHLQLAFDIAADYQ